MKNECIHTRWTDGNASGISAYYQCCDCGDTRAKVAGGIPPSGYVPVQAVSDQTIHPADQHPAIYTYCGISSPLALWNAVGLETINWVNGTVEFPRRRAEGATDAELIEARFQADNANERALVWLIQERRRQREEAERTRAMIEAALAQKKAGDDAIHAARIERQAAEMLAARK